jgi:glutamyl-tRNA reductase
MRVEIAWAAGPESTDDVLAGIYGDSSAAHLPVIRRDSAAFHHLCRVAAGLGSPLIGEKEVLAQFRNAVSVALETPTESSDLRRVLEAVVGIARSTRRKLVAEPTGSLATLAAGAASSFERVAILGAGAMARAAAGHLDAGEVSVFARRTGQIAGTTTRAWDEVPDAIATYPVILSTVPGRAPLFPADVVSGAYSRRREPLLLIDIGMPPGWDRPDSRDPVRYMGVDEVASSVVSQPSADVEEHILSAAAAAWNRLETSARVGAVIEAMVEHAETAVSEEVERFARRLQAADDPEPVLRQLARTVARRVIHPPISYIGSAERGNDAVEFFAEAFGVDDA